MINDSKRVSYDAASGKLFVMNARLATAVNKVLKIYDDGKYLFQSGEEAIFKVPSNQLSAVTAIIETFR